MATGKVARRTAVADVAALLDSPEVASLVAELDALRWTGRKGYGVRALVGACLVKSLFALPTWTRVVALIDEHPGLREVLGASPRMLKNDYGLAPLRVRGLARVQLHADLTILAKLAQTLKRERELRRMAA